MQLLFQCTIFVQKPRGQGGVRLLPTGVARHAEHEKFGNFKRLVDAPI